MTYDRNYDDIIDFIDNKISSFIELNKWERVKMSQKNEWVSNFKTLEQRYLAYRLLNKFIYYSETEIMALCKRLLTLLQRDIMVMKFRETNEIPSNAELAELYKLVDRKSVFTYIVGENQQPGSGITMFQHYRALGKSEQLVFHTDLYKKIYSEDKSYVVLFDDLIGTGSQAVKFWNLPQYRCVFKDALVSLQEISEDCPSVNFYYLALAGTPSGIEYIKQMAPRLQVIVAETLSSNYGVFKEGSIFWSNEDEREAFKAQYQEFCKKNGIHQEFGIGNLELALAFSHCIPDNTLPIFRWEEGMFNPFIRRFK